MISLMVRDERHYFKHVTEQAATAGTGDRLALATMNFDPQEEAIHTLMAELGDAAARGADARLLVDAHAFMIDYNEQSTGPLLTKDGIENAAANAEFAYKYDVLQQLGKQGVSWAIINQPRSHRTLPVAGRSHIKFFLKNNTVNIGGCNLGRSDQIDSMVEYTQPTIANRLFGLAGRVAVAGNVREALQGADQRWKVDEMTELLIDAGVRNQSTIMDEAMALIDSAQEYVFMTCQFFPNSRTASHLARAHRRGVQHIEPFYNHPSHHGSLRGMIQQAVLLGEKARLPQELFTSQMPAGSNYLHAKIIATDQGAIIGSHNYVNLGVRLGTAEIALLRRDPAFSRQLIEEIRPRLVAEAEAHQ